MEISKVKIVEGETLCVVYTIVDGEGKKAKHTVDYETAVHPDLKAAFKKLDIHFGLLTESIDLTKVLDIGDFDKELIENIHTSSYSKKDKEDDPGIVLSGHKILKNGKALIMNCPYTRFMEKEDSVYKYIDNLETVLGEVEDEVQSYLAGKHAEAPQIAMEFPDEAVTTAQIATPENVVKDFVDRVNSGIPLADPEAMGRVKEMDKEKSKKQKRVKQTAENPSGIE